MSSDHASSSPLCAALTRLVSSGLANPVTRSAGEPRILSATAVDIILLLRDCDTGRPHWIERNRRFPRYTAAFEAESALLACASRAHPRRQPNPTLNLHTGRTTRYATDGLDSIQREVVWPPHTG